MTLTGRVGRFFFLFGGLLLLIFFASDLAESPRFNLFFFGLLSVVVGLIMIRRGRIPPEPSGRFRMLRTWRQRGKKRPGQGAKAENGSEASEETEPV
jgi:hypothetical protein